MALPQLFVTVGAKIDGFEKAMGTVSQRLNAMDREAQRAFSGFDKLGQRLTSIGTSLTAAVTLPLAGAGVAATKFAADFEAEVRKVTSLLGGSTKQEFDSLNKQVLAVSRSMGVDATKSAQALYEVISAGIPKGNAIEFLGEATKTAIAGTTDTKVAVDALTTIIAAYGLETSEANKVSDAMFQAVNVGKFQFEDLAKAIGPAAQQASNLGISYEELLAATGTLSITSGGVSQAVTQIESAMRALLAPTKEMSAALEAIGFQSGSAAVKTLGFEGTLEALRKQTKGSSEEFNALFGRIEGAIGALGLTGPQALRAAKDLDTLKQSSAGLGATQKALDEINKGTTRQFEALAAQLKVTAIELGTALLPAVGQLLTAAQPLVGFLAKLVDSFTKLPQPVQTAAIAMAAIAAAAGPLVLISGQAIVVFSTLVPAITSLSGAFLAFSAGPLATLSTVTIPAVLAGLRTFAVSTIPMAITAVSALASTMLTQAIVSVTTFATVTVPAATAALLRFAATAIPSAIAGLVTLTTVSIPAATTSFLMFARTGVAAAGAALMSFATVSIQAAISALHTIALTVLPLLGVAAVLAASAFAGFKLGQWAYDQVPGFKTLGDAIADTLMKIPGMIALINKLSGATAAQKAADEDLEFATGKLNAALARKGLAVDSAGRSLTQLSKAQLDAAKASGLLGSATDIERSKIDAFKKEIQESDKKAKLYNIALAELGKQTKDLGEHHKKAAGHVRQFVDIFPVLAAKFNIVKGEQSKFIEQQAAYELALERGEKSTVDFTDGLVALAEAVPALKTELLSLPPGFDQLQKSMKDSVKPIEDIIEAYHRMGQQAPAEIQKTVAANRAAWETIRKDSGTNSVAALEAWTKYEESRQDAARRSGQIIPAEEKKALDKAQAQLDVALGKQTGSFGRWSKQVSTIINDFAKDLARGAVDLVKNLFDFDGFNKKLREDTEKLKGELAERTSALDKFQADAAAKIASVESGYAEKLATETGELRDSLAERVALHGEFVQEVAGQLETLRNAEGERLAGEQSDLADKLRDKEASYEEYVAEIGQKEEEIRRSHAERLAEQLADLRDNLRDRQQSYEDFVADANRSLLEIGADLGESIEDATRSSNRRVEDENIDFARDQEKLNEDIRDAEKKGDKTLVAELRRSLERRTQDHQRSIQRLQEDIAEQVSDAQKRAQEQTDDLNIQLDRRTRDHKEYVSENISDQDKVTAKNRESLASQLANLQESVDKRTAELLKFRDTTAEAMQEAADKSAARYHNEERDLAASLAERGKKLSDYESEVSAKIEALTKLYADKQAEEVAALRLELGNKLSEYDEYRVGVESKLEELVDAHKGPLDRIKDMFKTVFDSAAEAILRVASEEVIGKLVGKLTGLIADTFPKLGAAIKDVLGIAGAGASAASSAAGAVGGGAGSIPTGGGGVAGAASGLGSTVDLITGAISAAANVVSAIYNVRIEGTLNKIEENTRFAQIHLENTLKRANDFWPYLRETHMLIADMVIGTLREIRDGLKTLFSVNVNLTGDEQKALVSSLITRVGTFDTIATDRLLDIYARAGEITRTIQDGTKSITASIDSGMKTVTGGLAAIERKLPSTIEGLLGGGGLGGIAGLAGMLPAAIAGLITGLVRGGGKTEDLIEENTRYTAAGIIGPAGVVDSLRTFLPLQQQVVDFDANIAGPWMANVQSYLEGGLTDRIMQVHDVIASTINDVLVDIREAVRSPQVIAPGMATAGGGATYISIAWNANDPTGYRGLLDSVRRGM